MSPPEPFLIFTRKLNELNVRYMISGSVAAIFYGEPRLTNNVDIIVFLRREDVTRLEEIFPDDEFYKPPGDIIALELARRQRGHFNLIHHETGFKADIYPAGRDPLHTWGFSNAKKVALESDTLWLAPPEYVIIRKLEFYREGGAEKHLRDISRMLTALGEKIDHETLQSRLSELGLQAEWAKVLNWQE